MARTRQVAITGHLKGIRKGRYALHELGPATVVFRSIILVDEQNLDLWKAGSNGLPEILQAIDNEIAGDPSGGEVQIEFIRLGQKYAIRGQLFFRLEIMVKRLDDHTSSPPARKPTDGNRGFGIHRDPQDTVILFRLSMDLGQFFKNRIRFRNLFLGDFSGRSASRSPTYSSSPEWFPHLATPRRCNPSG